MKDAARRYRIVFALILMCAPPLAALEPITLRSRSGQFILQGIPLGPTATPAPSVTNLFVRLDPSVMAVSCERIKTAVLTELDDTDPWRDTISIFLRPVQHHEETIDRMATRYRDGWSYRMSVPDHVRRSRLLKALVEVLLLERAQRVALERPVEVPSWLSEGLAAHLEATVLGGLTLEPHTSTFAEGRRRDPVVGPRELLRAHRALTVEQLSWPTEEQLTGADGGLFRACAHVFVRELLRVDNGPARLRELLQNLPRFLNWQTAFLRAYEGEFRRMVDVEKWWALKVAHLTGVDAMSVWTPQQTLAQLEEALVADVQVREGTNNLPRTERLILQQVLTRTQSPGREALLNAKIHVLDLIRLRSAPGLAPLVEAYETTLQDYLRAPRMTYSATESGVPRKLSLREAIARLDSLDDDRAALRRQFDFALTVSP